MLLCFFFSIRDVEATFAAMFRTLLKRLKGHSNAREGGGMANVYCWR